MKQLSTIFIILFFSKSFFAQPTPKIFYTTKANELTLPHGVAGGILYDSVATFAAKKPTVVYSTGLWIGGFKKKINQIVAFSTYHQTHQDFVAGPLDLTINEPEKTTLTKQFDKIWVVYSSDIQQHRIDFQDGKIDNPSQRIMAWPAKGNPQFEQYNGFKNKYDYQDLAPFKDVNQDGVYSPLFGDYPIVKQADEMHQPDEIFWSIFNDNLTKSSGDTLKLNLEIQQLGWVYSCTNSPLLNNANFLSFSVLNKGKTKIDSMYLGYWSDLDLGCYKDDYMGCSPNDNAFFIYNGNEKDNMQPYCPKEVIVFKSKTVPTVSVSLLNQKMESYLQQYLLSSGVDHNFTSTTPVNGFECYRYLNAIWKDGTPLSFGGSGYTNDPNAIKTKFLFNGNPNKPNEWSSKSADIGFRDVSGVASVKLKTFTPNEKRVFDVAIVYHYDSTKTSTAEQIDYMYENLPKIQNLYNQYFKSQCLKSVSSHEAVSLQNISIYPNPFENSVTINNGNNQNIDFQLFNFKGQTLQKGGILAKNRQTLATDFLPKGIYFIELKGENGARKVEKLVKM